MKVLNSRSVVVTNRLVTGFNWKKDGQALPRPVPQDVLTTVGGGVYTVTADVDALDGCPTDLNIPVSTTPTDPGDLDEEYVICPSETNPDPTTRLVTLDPDRSLRRSKYNVYRIPMVQV